MKLKTASCQFWTTAGKHYMEPGDKFINEFPEEHFRLKQVGDGENDSMNN